jgi:hypothetical protein
MVQILSDYKIPFEFSHFSKPMTPPFMVYTVPSTNNFKADNSVYLNVDEVEIELYTRQNTLSEEKALEKYMSENGIIWDKVSQSWLDDEKIFMTVYEVS